MAQKVGEKKSEVFMIGRVHHLLNDTIMAFDGRGTYLESFTGKFTAVIEDVLKHTNDLTEFYVEGVSWKISRELFVSRALYNFIKDKPKEEACKSS